MSQMSHCGQLLQERRKTELKGAPYAAHTMTSKDDSEIANLLDKCHHVKSMFQLYISSCCYS